MFITFAYVIYVFLALVLVILIVPISSSTSDEPAPEMDSDREGEVAMFPSVDIELIKKLEELQNEGKIRGWYILSKRELEKRLERTE